MQIQEVTDAFSLDRVVPFFQPIMDITHNSVWRYECLARLVTFEQNAFTPCEFLYLIEQQAANEQLTETIFHQSAEYFRNQHSPWSINLSHTDITNANLASWLVNYLKDYPYPDRVGFEIPASTMLNKQLLGTAFYALCDAKKIRLYVDHFDLNCLPQFTQISAAIEGIKLDVNLLSDSKNKHQPAAVKQLLTHCQQHNIEVIAERVEQPEQLALVNKLGIRYAQGFHLSMPEPAVS